MRVTAALLGRFTETEPDGGLLNILGGGTDLFGCPEVPVEFSMPFALQLRYPESEAETTFAVGMLIRGPDPTAPLGEPTEFEITPQLGEYHAPGWEGVFYVAGIVGLYAEEYGAHSVSVLIDGAEQATIPYQVVAASAT